jgi:hypothetical protein
VSDGREANDDRYPGAPGWVKVFTVVLVAIVLVVVVFLVLGTALGLHTPGGPGHGG